MIFVQTGMWQVDVCQWLPARIGRSECLNPAIGKPKTTGVMWRGTKPVAHSAQRLSPALRAPPLCRCAERATDLV